MVVTLSQQYNVGEKPTVILNTYINRHAGTPEKQQIQKHSSTLSNMVVIIYCLHRIDCKDKDTTLYLNGFPDDMYVCTYVWSSHIAEFGSIGKEGCQSCSW